MSLKYKTRGNSSPNRKPKVFLSSHPQDLELFIDEICSDILAIEDCAIYYFDNESNEEEERYSILQEMQLFVIPVTYKLISSNSNAINDFNFALEKHIPILPLMQEPNLEELFNKRCGDLQCLDKYKKDNSAISYEEKLKKYLNSILVGDELAQKVRGAFDAYIFLSYRKKDRKLAQELMRLIHKNELFRDIAIWYDEFLAPGENFNTSIEQALKKSDLFVLAVTPNLVNEVNYVMTIEYPTALNEGKNILPIELVDTDKNQLVEYYPNVPKCVSTQDENELSKQLVNHLKIIKEKDNNSPLHQFYIGLAYLSGIDVEIDYNKALMLIKSAAEKDLPEAIKKLSSMYRYGEGVTRDYDEAISWYNRLCQINIQNFEASNSLDDRKKLIESLYDEADFLTIIGGRDMKLKNICLQIVKYSLGEEEFTYQLVYALIKCGDLSISNTDLTHILLDTEDIENFEALDFEQRNKVQMDYYVLALHVCENAKKDTLENNLNKAYLYLKLSQNTSFTKKNNQKEREYINKAKHLSENIYNDTNNLKALEIMGQCYSELSRFEYGENDAQIESLNHALEIFEKLVEQSNSISNQIFVAKTHKDIGIAIYASIIDATKWQIPDINNPSSKIKIIDIQNHYKKALKIYDEVASKTEILTIYDDLLYICEELIEFALDENERKKYQDLYEKYYRSFMKASVINQAMKLLNFDGNQNTNLDDFLDKTIELDKLSKNYDLKAMRKFFISLRKKSGLNKKQVKSARSHAEKTQKDEFDNLCFHFKSNACLLEDIANYFKSSESYELLLFECKRYYWLLLLSNKYEEILQKCDVLKNIISQIDDVNLAIHLYKILLEFYAVYPNINEPFDAGTCFFIHFDSQEILSFSFKCHKRALQLRKEMIQLSKSDKVRYDLDKLYFDIGKFITKIFEKRNVLKAINYLFTPEELALGCERFGAYKSKEDPILARESYMIAIYIMELIISNDDNIDNLLIQSRIYEKAARVSKSSIKIIMQDPDYGDLKKEEKICKELHKSNIIKKEQIYKRTHKIGDYYTLSAAYYNYGLIVKKKALFEKALKIILDLLKQYPNNQLYNKRREDILKYMENHFNS